MSDPKGTIHCIAYCITPIHLVSVLSAVRTLHPNQNIALDIVVHWPGFGSAPHQKLLTIFQNMAKGTDEIHQLAALDQQTYEQLITQEIGVIRTQLEKITGARSYQEIYFPHDNSGSLYQLLCVLNPGAQRICFGDGLGTVYEKQFQLSLIKTPLLTRLMRWPLAQAYQLRQRLRGAPTAHRSLAASLLQEFPPHVAALILPTDQSGTFLRDVRLVVVPKSIFLQTLAACSNATQDFHHYQQTLLDHAHPTTYLLVTSNFAECGYIDLASEINMWCSIIRNTCTRGSTIIIKNHPGEKLPRNLEVKHQLGADYDVVWLEDQYLRFPVELMEIIIRQSPVICFSASMLSIEYAFGTACINPFNAEFIDRWFPNARTAVHNAAELYTQPLRRLASWDGKSLLWSPTLESGPHS